jgi:hypothetical protein
MRILLIAAALLLAHGASALAQKNEGLGVVAPIQKDQSDQAPFPAPRKMEAPAPVTPPAYRPKPPSPPLKPLPPSVPK